jgi:hypothetical protein
VVVSGVVTARNQTQSRTRCASAELFLLRSHRNLGLLALQRPVAIARRRLTGHAVSAAVDVHTTASSAHGMLASRAVISTSRPECCQRCPHVPTAAPNRPTCTGCLSSLIRPLVPPGHPLPCVSTGLSACRAVAVAPTSCPPKTTTGYSASSMS